MKTLHSLLQQKRPLIMGVLNVTPDSFSDGGLYRQRDAALKQAENMLHAGADILDIGGESTRPKASEVSTQEELDRVIPVIEALQNTYEEAYISIDTSKLVVMQAAVEAGAHMINDVNALRNQGCTDFAVQANVDMCLMHMQGKPKTMQDTPQYNDVVQEVSDFLQTRANACVQAGADKKRIVLDPGFGFGKILTHNVNLFKEMQRLKALEYPLLIGVSRKSMLGALLADQPVEERMLASVIAAVKAAVHYQADIVRVHDVQETVDALTIWRAL